MAAIGLVCVEWKPLTKIPAAPISFAKSVRCDCRIAPSLGEKPEIAEILYNGEKVNEFTTIQQQQQKRRGKGTRDGFLAGWVSVNRKCIKNAEFTSKTGSIQFNSFELHVCFLLFSTFSFLFLSPFDLPLERLHFIPCDEVQCRFFSNQVRFLFPLDCIFYLLPVEFFICFNILLYEYFYMHGWCGEKCWHWEWKKNNKTCQVQISAGEMCARDPPPSFDT